MRPRFWSRPSTIAWITIREVINTEGEVIPGLYATGCDAGGLYGDAYDVNKAPGSQSSWACNSGRFAAQAAAKYLGK